MWIMFTYLIEIKDMTKVSCCQRPAYAILACDHTKIWYPDEGSLKNNGEILVHGSIHSGTDFRTFLEPNNFLRWFWFVVCVGCNILCNANQKYFNNMILNESTIFYVKVKGLFILPDELSTLGYFDLDPHWVLLYWEGGVNFPRKYYRIEQAWGWVNYNQQVLGELTL